MKKYYLSFLCVSLLLGACNSKIELDKATSGTADFSNYIAIGNSLTAGYADNSLYRSGQESSFPNILAGQLKYAGGGDFLQPLLPGNSGWPSRKLELGYRQDCKGATSMVPVPYQQAQDTLGSSTSIGHLNFNNLGIPGIKLAHIALRGYAQLNPYAGRFFNNPSLQSPIDVYLKNMPTFFTSWLGNMDVLAYATSGGSGSVSGTGIDDITPLPVFNTMYDSLLSQLTRYGAKGVLINIPDVSSTPFFNVVNPKGLEISSYQADILNAAYAQLGMSHITFQEGANYFVVEDVTQGARKMRQGELILMNIPSDSLKCGGWGSAKPIPKEYVLDLEELNNIKEATDNFNIAIASFAAKYDLAVFDANEYLKSLAAGIKWDGIAYSPNFVTGGVFSLDGIHLTPRGNALVANELIKVINAKYGSTLPAVNGNAYPGIKFP